MGWRERDYSQVGWSGSDQHTGGLRRPPPGALVLMALHVVAWVAMLVMSRDADTLPAPLLPLAGQTAHPLGILLHPFTSVSLWTLAITLLVIWLLAARLEARLGLRAMLGLYCAGNVFAGGVYFALARVYPPLAGVALDYPAGALAAWCFVAWRTSAGDMFTIAGRLVSVSKAVLVGVVVVAGLVLLGRGSAGVAWLLAIAAGLLAVPAVNCASAVAERASATPPPVRPRPRRPAPPPPPREPDIDDILEKITRAGMDSLTREERDRLEQARQAKLRRSR
ncbi:MAG: rhomboid family intramembrane serine protease [Planctomycetes bacterium]|nr:rhomboid family intramembrane serine protease [Planctomycetota bacterium]